MEVLGEDTYFVQVTREDYIAAKAEGRNISCEEAEAELDAKIAAALAALPSPTQWKDSEGFDNGDTTRTVYGWLYKTYTHKSGMQVEYGVWACKLCSRQGSIWVEVDDSKGYFRPSSGAYTFDGTIAAELLPSRKVLVSMVGYFEIAREDAVSLGIDLDYLSFSHQVSGTTYYRCNVDDSFSEGAGGGN